MGKKDKGRRRNRGRGGASNDSNKPARKHYDSIIMENDLFDTYYKAQKLVEPSEWESFKNTIKTPLPTTFRITGFRSEATALLNIIQGEFLESLANPETIASVEGVETSDLPEVSASALPWYPNKLAWQLNLSRHAIRRSAIYSKLHSFLISETETGNISRQEAVSMIPPIVLDVQSHHKVLDLCAAPGSKTAQLIEMLHRNEEKVPTGFVVANDVDNKRCYMLVHQAKRLQSPCLLVVNHNAADMPQFFHTDKDGRLKGIKFDRILCDVPCSGDGTIRKNVDVWRKWNMANGNNIHHLQYRIAKRGLEMLSVGGRMVYSTCSFNPIENEAVVARLLKWAGPSLKLVNVSDKVPGLKFTPGLNHWTPMSRDLLKYESIEQVPDQHQSQIKAEMFPPLPDQLAELNLNLCIRVLPHHQDTGGFFVAVFEKTGLLPGESQLPGNSDSGDTKESVSESTNISGPTPKKKRRTGHREDPFLFFEENESIWPSIKQFYGISDDLNPSWLLCRCREGKQKNVYFTNEWLKNIVRSNLNNLKIINTGVKVFVRCDNSSSECSYRLAQEGIDTTFPFVKSRRVLVPGKDFITLLSNTELDTPPELVTLSEESQEQFARLEPGSCVMVCQEDCGGTKVQLVMVAWLGKVSARAYVSKLERLHFLRLLGADTSKFEYNKFNTPEESTNEEATTNNGNENEDVSI